jgi:hypothetical protein
VTPDEGVVPPPTWEQMEGEGVRAYAAFILYRDLRPARRSIANAYRAHLVRLSEQGHAGGEPGVPEKSHSPSGRKGPPSHWEEWSVRWNWRQRAEAWDAHERMRELQERRQEHTNALEAHRVRAQRVGAALSEAAVRMLAIGNAELARLERQQKRLAQEEASGGGGDGGKKRSRGLEIPRGLATFLRASAAVGIAGKMAEAHALGVDELIPFLEQQDA